MIRRFGWLLVIIGLLSLALIAFAWNNGTEVNSYLFLGALGLFLGLILIRRPQDGTEDRGTPIAPARRRQQREHKSWISKRNDP